MTVPKDLTRWNRAGLSQFRYIDGNAAEYLETLRQQLHDKFADGDHLCDWLMPSQKTPVNETERDSETLLQRQERLSKRQQRLLETYHLPRRDWAWEISRSFARSCHILTEHANAYANEVYLGTATQWDHVRRLVEMLDYHPAPPASAFTTLAFLAKDNKAGLLGKGYQVRYTPPLGGAKIIFETLEDLQIDAALNELRPAGWNKSEDPSLPPQDNTVVDSEPGYSTLAESPTINIQGVGEIWSTQLDTLSDNEFFSIKDFLNLDTENPGIILDSTNPDFELDEENPGAEIGSVRLREFKARAFAITYFMLESGWSDIAEWLLPDIALASAELVSESTGKPLDLVKDLQVRIELIGSYLDDDVYRTSKLRDLLAPTAAKAVEQALSTQWLAPKKPTVESGQVAMILHQGENLAEAATISTIDDATAIIDLLPSLAQFSWADWPKGETRLQVSPRWKRKVWLNGDNVIRTEQAHGLSKGAYVSWRQNSVWQFAEILESDERHLRLDISGNLPQKDTLLYQAQPLESDVMATNLEAIGLASGDVPEVEPAVFEDLPEPIFTMLEPDPADPSLPPLMPPGSLSFGSFLFPTPMLPMDLVKFAVDMMLNLGVMVIPSTGEIVFKSIPGPGDLPTVDDLFDTLEDKVDWRDDLTNEILQKAALAKLLAPPADSPVPIFQNILSNLSDKGPLIAVNKNPQLKATVVASQPRYMVDGKPEKLAPGDWIVGRFVDGLRAVKIRSIGEIMAADKSESFSIGFENLIGNEGELQALYAEFRGELIAEGASFNSEPIDPANLELEQVPDSLKPGQQILLSGNEAVPVLAKIEGITGNSLAISPVPTGFSKGDLVISGNVVVAGHGEAKPAKILGSGDATKSNQSFTLQVEQLSFTPDATMSAGVAAAIEVEVAGRIWQQVSSLKDSLPGDHHYSTRMTEQGFVKIEFGDGEFGRRLPSGKNNTRIRYRVGSGISGNLPASSLHKAVNPHPYVESIEQPLAATGGGDMESITSLRENAPPTLLALERAVSLSDFAHLARSQSSIWQAAAYHPLRQSARLQQIEVIVVPAGGAEITGLDTSIQLFLQKHALPGVQIRVLPFEPEYLSLTITLRIRSEAFSAGEVERSVTTALIDAFSLQKRKLGQHLYLSEVYKIVERVQGVENSICVLNNESNRQVLKAGSRASVVHLDTERTSEINTIVEEYAP